MVLMVTRVIINGQTCRSYVSIGVLGLLYSMLHV